MCGRNGRNGSIPDHHVLRERKRRHDHVESSGYLKRRGAVIGLAGCPTSRVFREVGFHGPVNLGCFTWPRLETRPRAILNSDPRETLPPPLSALHSAPLYHPALRLPPQRRTRPRNRL